MKSEQTRARIRVAAAKVIERDGAGHLTLEKVAAEADLSKGGLLYHYPSKDALLQGLLDHLLENRAGISRRAEARQRTSVTRPCSIV
jgi:AcrR family transcriptional regulator